MLNVAEIVVRRCPQPEEPAQRSIERREGPQTQKISGRKR